MLKGCLIWIIHDKDSPSGCYGNFNQGNVWGAWKTFVSPLSLCVDYKVIMIGNEAIDYQQSKHSHSDISPLWCD